MLSKYVQEYKNITKISKLGPSIFSKGKGKDFFKPFTALGIQTYGQNELYNVIEKMRSNDSPENSYIYSRRKREVKEIVNSCDIMEESDLVEELNHKIGNVKDYLY